MVPSPFGPEIGMLAQETTSSSLAVPLQRLRKGNAKFVCAEVIGCHVLGVSQEFLILGGDKPAVRERAAQQPLNARILGNFVKGTGKKKKKRETDNITTRIEFWI